VTLIAFGTMFMPPKEQILKLLDAIKDPSMQHLGFILSLRRLPSTEHYYDEILSLVPENLLIKDFVP